MLDEMVRSTGRVRLGVYSPEGARVLRDGHILREGEDPDALALRVADAVAAEEPTHASAVKMRDELLGAMAQGHLTLGSPALTNAGVPGRPLSSCVAIPVDLQRPITELHAAMESYYRVNMGSGFDLSPTEDPLRTLLALDAHAASQAATGDYERYIGNMASLAWNHPRVSQFVAAKRNGGLSHFNISVTADDNFMRDVQEGHALSASGGHLVDAGGTWNAIVDNAWACGDPGLLFLDRFRKDNPTPLLGDYVTTAPCAEVGLAPGESCVFGYVNLSKMVGGTTGSPRIYDDLLRATVNLMTRALDNALEVSIRNYPMARSRSMMTMKRKIGIGVCGFADLLVEHGIPYGSPAAVRLIRELLSRLNFYSKLASMDLGKQRGSFPALPASRYLSSPSYLESRFGGIPGGVARSDWRRLDELVRSGPWLRHATTTALPPSGRSALILNASNSIEPWFSVLDGRGQPRRQLVHLVVEADRARSASILGAIAALGTAQLLSVPMQVASAAKTAIELDSRDHIAIAAAATECVDEAASKTVNLPDDTTPEQVAQVFLSGWRAGLKAISVYRDGSRVDQPETFGEPRAARSVA